SGFHSEYRDKTIRYRPDVCDGQQIVIREFYDHAIKSDFLLGRIGKRSFPRLWFPRDLIAAAPWVVQELRAERLKIVSVNGRRVQKFVHDKQKHGPNDALDLGKNQYVIFQEIKEDLKQLRGGRPAASRQPEAELDLETAEPPLSADTVNTVTPSVTIELFGGDAGPLLDRIKQIDPSARLRLGKNNQAHLHAEKPLRIAFELWKAGTIKQVILPDKSGN
ncbi:MAG TPA: hypothetical protein DDZ88_27405, partial [Verrucomicrobiales bacterium]|nr:hypothetical protein [Verrucomicrobiales bacterium]